VNILRRGKPLVSTLSLTLLCAQTVWVGDLTRGELRREDVVRIDVVGHGRSVGCLLGVERDVLLLGVGRKVERIPTVNIMRVWRDDSRMSRKGRTVLGVLAGVLAGGLVAAAIPKGEPDPYWTPSTRELTGGEAVAVAAFVVVGCGVGYVVSRRSGGWTEVAVSELKALDALPAVQELLVDPEPPPETPEPDATDTAR
jgi:hypothetical protein